MKKVFLLILCALSLSACRNQKTEGFIISGTLKGDAEGGKVILSEYSLPPVKLDSAIVKNGRFTLKGKVDNPCMCSLVIDLNKPRAAKPDYRNKMLRVYFYLENSRIAFQGDVATLPAYYYNPARTGRPLITGSASQDLLDKLRASTQEVADKLNELDKRYSAEYLIPESEGRDATERGVEIVKAENLLGKRLKEATWKFIRENPSSVVAFDEASNIINNYNTLPTAGEMDELLAILGKYRAGSKPMEQLRATVATLRKLAPGRPYIDMELLNAKGEKVRLSSLIPKGKYVMLEFWASWCGPCRGEIPHLRKVYEKYKDFQLISISVDAKDKDWQKAMKEEGMPWTQLRNPEGMNGAVKEKYNVLGVPTCIVLDKEGRFYKTNMRGAYLDEFLIETYGK